MGFDTITPFYYEIDKSCLLLDHTGHSIKRTRNLNNDVFVEDEPIEAFKINFSADIEQSYGDCFTTNLTDGTNTIYFNRGNPYVTIDYDNTVVDIDVQADIDSVDEQPTYSIFTTKDHKVSKFEQYLTIGNDALFSDNLKPYDGFDRLSDPLIITRYTGHKLEVSFPQYSMTMNPINGQPYLPLPSNVNVFWTPNDFGFIVQESTKVQLIISVKPQDNSVSVTRKEEIDRYWLMYHDFVQTLDITDNNISTAVPVTGILQIALLDDPSDVTFLDDNFGTYWKLTSSVCTIVANKSEYTITFDRVGDPLILKPAYWRHLTSTGLLDKLVTLTTPQFGEGVYHEITSNIVILESDPLVIQDLPSTSGLTIADKERLIRQTEDVARFFTINESSNINVQSHQLFIGSRLLLVGRSLGMSLIVEPLLSVKTTMKDRLTTLLTDYTPNQLVQHGGIIYGLFTLQEIGDGLYGLFMTEINNVLALLTATPPNLYNGLDYSSRFGGTANSLFAGYLLAKKIGNMPQSNELLCASVAMALAFREYGQLEKLTNQNLGDLKDLVGPIILTEGGKALTSLLSNGPSSYPERYYAIYQQQLGEPLFEFFEQYFQEDWLISLTNAQNLYNITQDQSLKYLSNTSIQAGPGFKKVFDTTQFGASGIIAMAKNPEVPIEFFSKAWCQLLKTSLDYPANLFTPGLSRAGLLYWMSINHRVDSLDFYCYQFFINPSSSCDTEPYNNQGIGWNISECSSCNSISVTIYTNCLNNDLYKVVARHKDCERAIEFKLDGIRKIVLGNGSYYQRAVALGISPRVLMVYSAAYLSLLAFADPGRKIVASYLTKEKFFNAFEVINSTMYGQYTYFAQAGDIVQYYRDVEEDC